MKNLSQISVILMKNLSHFGHLRLAGMKTVTPAFVSSVKIGAATSMHEITKIENKQNTSGCITHGHI